MKMITKYSAVNLLPELKVDAACYRIHREKFIQIILQWLVSINKFMQFQWPVAKK
jgi:hypothetical protein